jgi:hypothetical protein
LVRLEALPVVVVDRSGLPPLVPANDQIISTTAKHTTAIGTSIAYGIFLRIVMFLPFSECRPGLIVPNGQP